MRTIADIEILLNTMPACVPAALLQVKTKNNKVELREERGKWLQELWETLKTPAISECRSSWDEVFLFAPDSEKIDFERSLVSKLEKNTHPELNSYLLIANIDGPGEAKRRKLEEMQLQLNKLNYWNEHIFDNYYENGKRIELKKS